MYGEFPIAQFDYRRVTGEFTIRFVVFGCFWCLARLRDLSLKPGRCPLVRLLYLSFTNLIYIIYNMYIYIYTSPTTVLYIHIYIYIYTQHCFIVSVSHMLSIVPISKCVFDFLPASLLRWSEGLWRHTQRLGMAGSIDPYPLGGAGVPRGGLYHIYIYIYIVSIYLLDIVYCTYIYIYIHMYTYIYIYIFT